MGKKIRISTGTDRFMKETEIAIEELMYQERKLRCSNKAILIAKADGVEYARKIISQKLKAFKEGIVKDLEN